MGWLIPEGAQVDWQAWATFGAGLANAIAIIGAAILARSSIKSALNSRNMLRKAEVSEKTLKFANKIHTKIQKYKNIEVEYLMLFGAHPKTP